jgi:uncharacterized protein YndB with AHSA1/START domain
VRLERSIEIAASPARVWEVMSDAARWPEWTASVTDVRLLDAGPLRVGSRARIVQPKLPPAEFTVTELVPGTRFTWATGSWFARAVARHEVVPSPAGARATLSVEFGGLVGGLAGRAYRRLTLEYLDLEAEGLKARSEGTR